MKLYGPESRSSFGYWFAHWCAFQMVALLCGVWKPKYLLQDIEKPWLKLFVPYEKLKKWHRNHSDHHLEYLIRFGPEHFDYMGMLIDWDCGRFTKSNSPLRAPEYYETIREKLLSKINGDTSNPVYLDFLKVVPKLLQKYFNA